MEKKQRRHRQTDIRLSRRKLVIEDGETDSPFSQFFFSEELIIEILIRSHAKTLFRSKCVCRGWRSLISEQSFINRFYTRSKSLPPSITGFFGRVSHIDSSIGENTYFINTSSSDDGFIAVDGTLSFLTAIHGPVIVIDSNNGLLLCAEKSSSRKKTTQYFVCNPITKQWVTLPAPICHDHWTSALLYCYDVDVHCSLKTEFIVYCFHKLHSNLLKVEMYCSKAEKWKRPKTYQYVWFVKEFTCMTLFNGSAYWLKEDGNIAVLDLKKENIRTVEFPRDATMQKWILHLGVSAGSLYVTERSRTCFFVWVLVNGLEFHLNHSIEVESLRGNKDTISTSYKPNRRLCVKFLGFHSADYKLVFVELSPHKASVYCLDKKRVEYINGFHPKIFCNGDLKLFPYSLPAWPTCITSKGSCLVPEYIGLSS